MASSEQLKGREVTLMVFDLSIQTLNIVKDACSVPPTQAALGSASVILAMIRVPLSPFREDKLLTPVV